METATVRAEGDVSVEDVRKRLSAGISVAESTRQRRFLLLMASSSFAPLVVNALLKVRSLEDQFVPAAITLMQLTLALVGYRILRPGPVRHVSDKQVEQAMRYSKYCPACSTLVVSAVDGGQCPGCGRTERRSPRDALIALGIGILLVVGVCVYLATR